MILKPCRDYSPTFPWMLLPILSGVVPVFLTVFLQPSGGSVTSFFLMRRTIGSRLFQMRISVFLFGCFNLI